MLVQLVKQCDRGISDRCTFVATRRMLLTCFSQRQEDERRRQQSMEMLETRRHEDMLWRQHRKMADEDPFGGSSVCTYLYCL